MGICEPAEMVEIFRDGSSTVIVDAIPHFSGLSAVCPPATSSCMACLPTSYQPPNWFWLPVQSIAKNNIRIMCKKSNTIIGLQPQPLPGFWLPLTYVSRHLSQVESCGIISYLLFPDVNIWLLLICSACDQVSITWWTCLIICVR